MISGEIMNTLDIICLAVIAVSVIICLLKGFKNIFFKLCSFVIAMYVAKIYGARVGEKLLAFLKSHPTETVDTALLERLSDSVVSVIGVGLVFTVLYFVLRLIFKIASSKVGQNAGSIIADKLLGALVGLLLGVAIIFVLTEATDFVLSTVAYFKQDHAVFEIINESKIFKFFENFSLNI